MMRTRASRRNDPRKRLRRQRLLFPANRMLVVVLMMLLPAASIAQSQDSLSRGWPTELEFMAAPDYCKAKFAGSYFNQTGVPYLRFPAAEAEAWHRRIGPVFVHLHHYCKGTLLLSRAENLGWLRRTGHSAREVYRAAVREIRYTVNRDYPGNPLWAQMRLDFARALEGAGNVAEAEQQYQLVLAQMPENEHLYITWAQMLQRQGRSTEALEMLQTGEQRASNRGPIYFHLATLLFDRGDLTGARDYARRAEQAGMNMARFRARLDARGGATAPQDGN